MQNRFSTEIQTIVLLCLVLIFQACKTPTTIEGPELNDLYGPFVIKKPLTVSTKTPDFTTNDKVSFSLELNKVSDWTITITGLNSNAIKIISGKSKIIDQTNAVWNGSTTIFPRFGIEKVKVELSFKDTALVLRDTLQILSPMLLKSELVVTQFPVADLGTLFSAVPRLIDYSADGDLIATSTTAPYKPVLGSSCLTMKAVDKNKDTYLGNVTYVYKVFNPTSASNVYPITTSDANQLYFNLAVFGISSAPGSTILIQFFEDTDSDGTYKATKDNQYQYRITPTWTGWKLVSFKYNQAIREENSVNPITPFNPTKILQIGFIHLGNIGLASEIALDYPCFTSGSPLEP